MVHEPIPPELGLLNAISAAAFFATASPRVAVELVGDIKRVGLNLLAPVRRLLQNPTVRAIKLKAIKADLALLGIEAAVFGLEAVSGKDLLSPSELGGLVRVGLVQPFIRQLVTEFRAGGIRRAGVIGVGVSTVALLALASPVIIAGAAGTGVAVPVTGIALAIAFGSARRQDLDLFGL